MEKIKCGDCNKFYRCTTCDNPCGSEGHFISMEKKEDKPDTVKEQDYWVTWLKGKLVMDEEQERFIRHAIRDLQDDCTLYQHTAEDLKSQLSSLTEENKRLRELLIKLKVRLDFHGDLLSVDKIESFLKEK